MRSPLSKATLTDAVAMNRTALERQHLRNLLRDLIPAQSKKFGTPEFATKHGCGRDAPCALSARP